MTDHIHVSADFDPRVKTYWLLSGALALILTIIGIPLLLLWFPIGMWATGRYLDNLSAELLRNKLIVKSGILTRVEKTVPLDKITDLALVQGPVMRFFGLHKLSVETAGQSGTGSLISLVGVVDAPAFRERVLEQRDRLTEHEDERESTAAGSNEVLTVLRDISETLKRIEAQGGGSGK